jgi:hypothetical protein
VPRDAAHPTGNFSENVRIAARGFRHCPFQEPHEAAEKTGRYIIKQRILKM